MDDPQSDLAQAVGRFRRRTNVCDPNLGELLFMSEWVNGISKVRVVGPSVGGEWGEGPGRFTRYRCMGRKSIGNEYSVFKECMYVFSRRFIGFL